MWGTVSVSASSGFAYWTSHQGFVTQDQQAQLAAQLREFDKKLDIVVATAGGLGPRIGTLEDKTWLQSNKSASLESWAKTRGFRP